MWDDFRHFGVGTGEGEVPNPSSAADVEGVTFCEVGRVRKKVRNVDNVVASINFII